MEKFDIRSMRMIIILLIIISIFLIFIGLVFDAYENKKIKTDTEIQTTNEEIIEEIHDTNEEIEENTIESNSLENNDTDEQIYSQENNREYIEPLENLYVEEETENTDINSTLQKAVDLQNAKNYLDSIEQYNKAIDMTSDIYVKADCYDEIAKMYTILKRYGSAMTFANKAYNIKPTAKRELLLASLYYKTGSKERALVHAEEYLKKDFAEIE